MFRQWRENHMFKIVIMPDEHRKRVQFIVVDQRANWSAPVCSS
jgi:hypothetical protein